MPVDQAKAQLYLTFGAHGNHKGAQMALGYRHWSGIGVVESCMAALDWYEDAAEQGVFVSYRMPLRPFMVLQPWRSSFPALLEDGLSLSHHRVSPTLMEAYTVPVRVSLRQVSMQAAP